MDGHGNEYVSKPMRMYCDYFGIAENAFAITPDPRYLFLSDRHREAMAHLLFGTEEGGGFVQITGEVGTGKTTTCRAFLEQLPGSVDVALLLSPPDSPRELLLAITAELGLRVPRCDTPSGELVTLLNKRLLETHAAGRRTVVIIDEAQNILPEVLEQVRLLTNLETPTHKLLQVFLIGQPELRQKLQHPALRQVAQRITARYHLEPLSLPEIQSYIQHRLAVAGCRQSLFSKSAIRQIHRDSLGIPRVINILCDRALIGAYANEMARVSAAIVRHAAREWRGEERGRRQWFFPLPRSVAALVIGVLLFATATAGFRGSAVLYSGVDKVREGEITSKLLRWLGLQEPAAHEQNPPPYLERNGMSALPAVPGQVLAPRAAPPSRAALVAELPATDNNAVVVSSVQHVIGMASPIALQALLERWNIHGNVVDRQALCARAERHGLQCLRDTGDWDGLRLFNRPALLTLDSRSGGEAYLALIGMDEKHAFVATTEGVISLKLHELDEYWSGEFVMLWRPPPGGVSLITAGADRPAVQWLQNALAHVDGINTSAVKFDQQLEQRIRVFQRSHGLEADGIAGPRTLIHLNNVLEQAVPLLLAANRNE